jgi:hypothetical protein
VLFRWCLIVAALNAVVLGSILVLSFGQRKTASPIDIFHFNEFCKLPCWIGITPGETSIEDAVKIALAQYRSEGYYAFQRDKDWIIIEDVLNKRCFDIQFTFVYSDVDRVEEVVIVPCDRTVHPLFTLSEFMLAVKVPSSLVNYGYSVLFKTEEIELYTGDQHVKANDALTCVPITFNLQLYAMVLEQSSRLAESRFSEQQQWQGFQPCYKFQFR